MGYDTPHEKVAATVYDVVIVGSGFAGANMAYLLGSAPYNKKVLIIEAGPGIERSREDYMENFFLNTFKSPSSPYPPNDNGLQPAATNAPRATIQGLGHWDDPAKSYFTYATGSLPFASTYERLAGGTGNHWMGTCLRMAPEDLMTRTLYGIGRDWPIGYSDLTDFYNQAEHLIGVSSDVAEQDAAVGSEWTSVRQRQFTDGYAYPMQRIPPSYWDGLIKAAVDGKALTSDNAVSALVSQTPAGRNAEPYMGRRVCHGNTNCTPVCPIQAKYDPQFTLSLAMDTGNVDMIAKSVVRWVNINAATNEVESVEYAIYSDISVPAKSGMVGEGTALAKVYVLAAHAVENARILLNSQREKNSNAANSSDMVGKNFMDHPTYLAWGLMPEGTPCYGYRGPLSTSGVENLRDGSYRSNRAPWRIEIGNEAWNWPIGDPYTSGLDYIYGTNNSGTNTVPLKVIGNAEYQSRLNSLLTRQFRMAFLVEQPADPNNKVVLSTKGYTDNLGLLRPEVTYSLDAYTMRGFQSAKEAASNIMQFLGATEYTAFDPTAGTQFTYNGSHYNYQGAGHLCGTHIMGSDPKTSVVNSYQQSWDNPNLYLVGCGSMPSIGTENPSLTMLALACRTATHIGYHLG